MITGISPSGLRYAVKTSGKAVAYCALAIRIGTRDENGFHSGIAHFTEHTIFKGTSRKSASVINSYLDRLGGELNAYTTKEEIVLHATVLKEDIGKAISLLLELASLATFPEKEIETERGVVIEEILSYKDSPADDVYDRFEEMLFEGHPLSRPILGTVASVKKINSEELSSFTRRNFRPGAMALSVVAPMDEGAIEKKSLRLIEKFFPEACDPDPVRRQSIPFTPAVFSKTVDKRHHEANAVFGSTAPSLYDEKERYAAVLLGNILAGPASNSMLGSVLRERNGWVYAVESSYTQYSETGIMAISLGCEKSNLDRCTKAIRDVLARIQDSPMAPGKLSAAKKQLLGQLAISSEGGESQCLSMAKSLLSFGKVSPDGEVREKVGAISSEDLLVCARNIFAPERISTLIYL